MVFMQHGQYHNEEKFLPCIVLYMGSDGKGLAWASCNSGEVTLLNRSLGLVLVYSSSHLVVASAFSRNRTDRRQKDKEIKISRNWLTEL